MSLNVWTLLGAERLSQGSRKKLGLVGLLYFIEGTPPAILWHVLPVYFREHGVSLEIIGGLRLLELPYSLKVLWSPLVHRYGDRRIWVLFCMLLIGMIVAGLPFFEIARPGWVLFLVVFLFTALSATQDVAIDSYTVGLVSREEEGPANGVRASAYRVALVLVGNGMVFLAAFIEWNLLYFMAGAFLVALALSLPFVPSLDLPAEAKRRWLSGFAGWIATWRAIPLALFVLTYRLGEFAIGPMIIPFWYDYGRSLGATREEVKVQIALIPGALGIGLSIFGALVGGAFVSRYRTFHGVWFLGLLQALSNLGYALVAWADLGYYGLYAASVFESFTGGLGTAAFLTFLMNICEKEHATVQYALLSSLFALSGRFVGGVSGFGAQKFGYGDYFAMTFLLSLPSYLFLPWVKRWIRDG